MPIAHHPGARISTHKNTTRRIKFEFIPKYFYDSETIQFNPDPKYYKAVVRDPHPFYLEGYDIEIYGKKMRLDPANVSTTGFKSPFKVIRAYGLEDGWTGGRLMFYEGGLVEITLYGSGVPIISSTLGLLKTVQ